MSQFATRTTARILMLGAVAVYAVLFESPAVPDLLALALRSGTETALADLL
jgi:hypothetical protein